MSVYTQEQVNYLVEGKLDWETTMRMLSMPKDDDRFRMYLNALQSKVPWDDKIILPISLHLYVADVDTVTATAIAAGAKLKRPVENQFYGDRLGTLEDPFGHIWHVSTHIEDVSPEEIGRRAAAAMQKGQGA